MFGGRDEIGEGVALMAHAAGIVPGFAEFAAAANVSYGIDDATVEQAKAIRTEIDRHGDAVASVAIKKKRRAAVARCRSFVDERERDSCAVGRYGVNAFTGVERGVVASEDWLLFAQCALAGGYVEIEDRARGDERFVGVAEMGLIEFRVGARCGVVGGFAEGNPKRMSEQIGWFLIGKAPIGRLALPGRRRRSGERDDTQEGKAVFAFEQDEVGAEG